MARPNCGISDYRMSVKVVTMPCFGYVKLINSLTCDNMEVDNSPWCLNYYELIRIS